MHNVFVAQHIVWLYTHWYLLGWIVLSSVLFGFYIKANEYHAWWFGCIPVIGKCLMWKVAGVPLVLLILSRLLLVFFLIDDLYLPMLVLLLIMVVIENAVFAANYTSANKVLWTLFPPYKYFVMCKTIKEGGV